MGIPFMPMDINDTINSVVNDAVGINPTEQEPAGPIDITDQVGVVAQGVWGSGGNVGIGEIATEYIGYYVELITQWPNASSINTVQGWNIDDRTDTVEGTTIITKGIITDAVETSPHDIGVMITSGSGITTNAELISLKVSTNEF